MSRQISKIQRWLDMIVFLSSRRYPVTVDEIMENVPAYAEKWASGSDKDRSSARRTFERDKDELRRMGIPLETVSYTVDQEPVEGYRIARRNFYLPYLRLLFGEGRERPPEMGTRQYADPARIAEVELRLEDARLAFDALRTMERLPNFPLASEARSALRKLSFDLGDEGSRDLPVVFADRPTAAETLEKMRLLSDALLSRKRVKFRYRGIQRDEVTDRDVAPYGLFYRGDWYLVGHDGLRDGIRVFRVSRMEDILPNTARPATPDFEIPDAFDIQDYLNREPWELGSQDDPEIEADVLFSFPRSLWAERNREGELVEQRLDGTAVRRFRVRQVNPLLRWVLGMAGEAAVVSPPELRKEYLSLAQRVAAAHGTTGASE